jgi:AcrR family transcriptional regulator
MADSDVRTRLREVALDLFGRHGVRETSTRQILTAAGLKNPSAISYHFGSKAELVDVLVEELYRDLAPVLQLQTELAEGTPPTVEAWTAIAVDSSSKLISTERGCLLARIWWEYDGFMRPNRLEDFLGSGHPVAAGWLGAVAKTFADMPQYVAVARNITMLRTLEWMIARRSGRLLTGFPSPALQVTSPEAFATLMSEVALGILRPPTSLTDEDMAFS